MNYVIDRGDYFKVRLSSWNKPIVIGEEFAIEVRCNSTAEEADPGGYGINFQKNRTEDAGIIFHFKPIAPESTVVFNTLHNKGGRNVWDVETRIQNDKVKEIYFSKSFKLKLKPITKSTILVYVNDSFITEYECKERDITETDYICFSPSISIEKY
ncbi:hypothetical protein AM593_04087, partial [Mytilus galloprovincialis]